MVVPMMQYRRNSEGDVTDKLYRATSMVVGSQESWKNWRALRANLSEAEAAQAECLFFLSFDSFTNICAIKEMRFLLCVYF